MLLLQTLGLKKYVTFNEFLLIGFLDQLIVEWIMCLFGVEFTCLLLLYTFRTLFVETDWVRCTDYFAIFIATDWCSDLHGLLCMNVSTPENISTVEEIKLKYCSAFAEKKIIVIPWIHHCSLLNAEYANAYIIS